MNTKLWWIVGLWCIVHVQNSSAQNLFFKEPRRGGFKFARDENVDITNFQHFSGSGMLAVGFYEILRSQDVSHAKMKAALLSFSCGMLKEAEDGYREGWGRIDTIFNQLGILSFLLLSDYAKFTLGIEQTYARVNDFGLSVRFFDFDRLPMNSSIGFYALYNTKEESYAGVDLHFPLLGRSDLHFGLNMVKLTEATHMRLQPNIGMSFKLL